LRFIVFDLEATCWKGRPPNQVQETIEIGALKMNAYGEVVDAFNRFIRPVVNPYLSPFCRELTTIRQEDVDRAETFPRVIEDFQDWAGIYEDNGQIIFCSWGNFDQKQLAQDCRLHDMEDDWIDPHLNIKRQYQEIRRLRRPWGLRHAVTAEGFEFTGVHHRGLSDAENLAKLFGKYLDEWRY
jgi:inhibitor of KinA sporulation pathway (predicted exonuclease)